MVTGIIEHTGEIVERREGGHGVTFVVAAPRMVGGMRPGDSVAINGVCHTIENLGPARLEVTSVAQTLRLTTMGDLVKGDVVNLERAANAATALGGHIVQGHVDGTGTVEDIAPDGDASLVRFAAPPAIMRYVVEKGFVAVDGTSLTVVNCDDRTFTVTIIPYTRENTVFGARDVGDVVNLEADIMAKYVERLAAGPRPPVDIADEL